MWGIYKRSLLKFLFKMTGTLESKEKMAVNELSI